MQKYFIVFLLSISNLLNITNFSEFAFAFSNNENVKIEESFNDEKDTDKEETNKEETNVDEKVADKEVKEKREREEQEEIEKNKPLDLMGKNITGNIRENGNPGQPLEIPTYLTTNNQAIHPRVIYDETGKFGHKWIMAFTPYSFMNDSTENPSIVVSDDGENWTVPVGLENPIVGKTVPENTHYSDVDVFINGDKIELWYRQSDKTAKLSRLLRRVSTDLVNWSEEEVILDYGTGGYGYGAASVILKDGEYNLYYKDSMSLEAENYMYRKSTDLKHWTEPVNVKFDFGVEWSNYKSWHVEFNYVNGVYYAVNAAFPGLESVDGSLFAFESVDGINFKNPVKVVSRTNFGFDDRTIYKSSFIVKDKEIYLYYSAINQSRESHIGLLKGTNFKTLEPVNGTGSFYDLT